MPLEELGIEGMTVSEVEGFESQKGHREIYAGSEYTVGFVPKVKFEIVISDNRVQKAVRAIVKAARTGKIGDGKVFVSGIEECIRIRTAERGKRQFEATQRKEPRTSAFYQLDNLLFSAEESSLSKKKRRRSAILAFLNRQIKFPACKPQNVAR